MIDNLIELTNKDRSRVICELKNSKGDPDAAFYALISIDEDENRHIEAAPVQPP